MDNSSTFLPHVPLHIIESANGKEGRKGMCLSEAGEEICPPISGRNSKWEARKEGLTLWELHYTADFKGGGRSLLHTETEEREKAASPTWVGPHS